MKTCDACGLRFEVIVDTVSVLANGIAQAGERLVLEFCPNCGFDDVGPDDGDEA